MPTSEHEAAHRPHPDVNSQESESSVTTRRPQGSIDDTSESLTPDELNEIVREALRLIGSEGLDEPDAHLEYVRRHLRAAVA